MTHDAPPSPRSGRVAAFGPSPLTSHARRTGSSPLRWQHFAPSTTSALQRSLRRARLYGVALGLGLAVVLCGAPSARAQASDLLPDLIVLPDYLHETDLDALTLPGHTLLRVSTATANVGMGRLEILGGDLVGPKEQEVVQRVYRTDGTRWERLAGTFVFHSLHEHVHFQDWTRLQLRDVTAEGGVGAILAGGPKISFCLLDLIVHDAGNPFFQTPGFYNSCDVTVQGITPGWADVYNLFLPDQWIDITGIPEGFYWVEAVVDPEDRILEADETNNTARVLVAVGPPPPTLPDAYENNDSFDEVDAREEGAPNSPNLGLVNARLEIEGLSMHDAADFFKFRTNSVGKHDDFVRIESPFMEGDIDLFLFDIQRTPLAGSFSSTNTEQVSLEGLLAGEYYIKVSRFFGDVPSYTLVIDPSGNAPPEIELLRPEAPEVWVERALETVPVQWVARDPEGDTTHVSLFADRDRTVDKETIPLEGYQDLPSEGAAANVNTATMQLGEWFLYARITDGSAVSDAWAPGSFIVYVKGDVNFDERVDRQDLRTAFRRFREGRFRDGWQQLLDMDRNGIVNIRDLRLWISAAVSERHEDVRHDPE